jgi:hypothetical protein
MLGILGLKAVLTKRSIVFRLVETSGSSSTLFRGLILDRARDFDVKFDKSNERSRISKRGWFGTTGWIYPSARIWKSHLSKHFQIWYSYMLGNSVHETAFLSYLESCERHSGKLRVKI